MMTYLNITDSRATVSVSRFKGRDFTPTTALKQAAIGFRGYGLTWAPHDAVEWWVAYAGLDPVGLVSALPVGSVTVHYREAVVLPEWRGRGLYRALWQIRHEWAVAEGYTVMRAHCTRDSRPLHERKGFAPEGPEDEYQVQWMRLLLPPRVKSW